MHPTLAPIPARSIDARYLGRAVRTHLGSGTLSDVSYNHVLRRVTLYLGGNIVKLPARTTVYVGPPLPPPPLN